ncbi:MAG TPA: hypothetical protein VK588_12470 [Chitinophagaceae bacterium]|nr:hypothetical protein [Chitinophagaceae bacterium]
MKHTNQEDSNRNQTADTDQQKKTNKAQHGGSNENMNQQHAKEPKDHVGKQGNDNSNWQKDKQGTKK